MTVLAKSTIILAIAVILASAIFASARGRITSTQPTYSTGGTDRRGSATEPTNSYPSHPSSPQTTTPHPSNHIFTADQARSQIEAKGFWDISGLQKDTDGNWRGKAIKNGNPVDVVLSFWGDLVAK
jgi:hypothetical protein